MQKGKVIGLRPVRQFVLLMTVTTVAAGLVSAAPRTAIPIALGRDGFSVGGMRLVFGRTARAYAIAMTARALGKPVETGSHGDCGQGDVIGYAKFRGDFELSFIGGKLSGWTEDGRTVATNRGIRVGATVASLRKAYPDLFTDPGNMAEGGLGPSFQSEIGPAGWLDGVKPGSKVVGMFSGATCLAGI